MSHCLVNVCKKLRSLQANWARDLQTRVRDSQTGVGKENTLGKWKYTLRKGIQWGRDIHIGGINT